MSPTWDEEYENQVKSLNNGEGKVVHMVGDSYGKYCPQDLFTSTQAYKLTKPNQREFSQILKKCCVQTSMVSRITKHCTIVKAELA